MPPCQLLFVDPRPGGLTMDLIMLEAGDLGPRPVARGAPFEISFDLLPRSESGRLIDVVVDLLASWATAGAVITVTARKGPAGAGLLLALGSQRVALVSGHGALAPGLTTLFRSGVVWGGERHDCATVEGELLW